MTAPVFQVIDAEDVAKEWFLTTSAAALVTSGGRSNVYMAMPKGSPLPSVILARVGGSPDRSDVPVDRARISFDCWAASRPQAKAIAKALASAVDTLDRGAAFIGATGRIDGAQLLSWLWLPDTVSDTPRYVIDVLLTCRHG